jgi:hypothetical protein
LPDSDGQRKLLWTSGRFTPVDQSNFTTGSEGYESHERLVGLPADVKGGKAAEQAHVAPRQAVCGEMEVREAPQQAGEGDLCLGASQSGADAVVNTVAEGQVPGGVAGKVEGGRVFVACRVAVGGGGRDKDDLVGRNADAAYGLRARP